MRFCLLLLTHTQNIFETASSSIVLKLMIYNTGGNQRADATIAPNHSWELVYLHAQSSDHRHLICQTFSRHGMCVYSVLFCSVWYSLHGSSNAILVLAAYANSKYIDEPAHLCSPATASSPCSHT